MFLHNRGERAAKLSRRSDVLSMEPVGDNSNGKPLSAIVMELEGLARVLFRKCRVEV